MTSKLAELIEAGKPLDADEREIAVLAQQHVDQAEQAENYAPGTRRSAVGSMS